MKYLRLFNEHSGYTEAMQTLEAPNVSHCVGENHVHYKPELPSVLPGNEEAWELYSSLVCDDERLKQDLKNIFSKYQVNTSPCSHKVWQYQNVLYTDNGTRFSYTDGVENYACDIFTSRSTGYEGQEYAKEPVTNDCGQNVLQGGVGSWRIYHEEVGPIAS